jgi:hypothetical protein
MDLRIDLHVRADGSCVMQKRRLACAPHSDHCCGLVWKENRPANVASRSDGNRPSERISQFLDQPRANGFYNHLIHMTLFLLIGRRICSARTEEHD